MIFYGKNETIIRNNDKVLLDVVKADIIDRIDDKPIKCTVDYDYLNGIMFLYDENGNEYRFPFSNNPTLECIEVVENKRDEYTGSLI